MKKTTLTLTEQEMMTLVIALDTYKNQLRAEYVASESDIGRGVIALNSKDVLALRAKLRNA